jgi:hypothetical protein
MISIFVSFILGNLIFFILLRGFLVPYFKAKGKGGVLLRVHRVGESKAIWRVALKDPSGIYKYKIGSQEHIFTPVPDSIFRCMRVSMADTDEEDTAPFIFKKVLAVAGERDVVTSVPKLDDKGKPVLDKDKKEVMIEKIVKEQGIAYKVFEGYDDSPILINMFKWALMRPKRKLGGMSLDPKTILIGIIILGAIVYFAMSMSGGGVI